MRQASAARTMIHLIKRHSLSWITAVIHQRSRLRERYGAIPNSQTMSRPADNDYVVNRDN